MRYLLFHKISIVMILFGVLLLIYPLPFISYFTYPIMVWGILGIIDFLNVLRWKISLMSRDGKSFWGIIIPISILYWLFFEYLNLLYPQWAYLNTPPDQFFAPVLTFISFTTVIPLIMEVLWLFTGPITSFQLPVILAGSAKQKTWILFPIGLLMLIVSLIQPQILQFMWIIPFLLFFPFVPTTPVSLNRFKFLILYLIVSAIGSGIIWETVNFWAKTKWQYLLLPHTPHLFDMPLLGYLGYIPFTLSTYTVYLWINSHVDYSVWRTALLYIVAFAASYLFIMRYFVLLKING